MLPYKVEVGSPCGRTGPEDTLVGERLGVLLYNGRPTWKVQPLPWKTDQCATSPLLADLAIC